jgi:Rieske Fe-S protein
MMVDTREQDEHEELHTRRKWLRWMSNGFLSLWGFAFFYVIGSFMKTPHDRRRLGERVIEAGTVDSLPVGQARMVRFGREPIFVIRTDEETLVGLAGVCTHLHCVLAWNEEQEELDCPCHRGSFDLNGNVLTGPAPSSLRRYDIETRLGRIYVRI